MSGGLALKHMSVARAAKMLLVRGGACPSSRRCLAGVTMTGGGGEHDAAATAAMLAAQLQCPLSREALAPSACGSELRSPLGVAFSISPDGIANMIPHDARMLSDDAEP